MAHGVRSNIDFDDEGSGSSMLVRSFVWGGIAAIAIGSVVLAAQTQGGAERLAAILGGAPAGSGKPAPAVRTAAPATPQSSVATLESRRLAESVRALTADRDRLLARLDAIERNLDVTASLPKESVAAAPPPAAASPPVPPNWSLVPSNIPPAAGVPANAVPFAPPAVTGGAAVAKAAPEGSGALVANEQATESVATKTEFGVDIGGDPTFDGLRALWAALKNGHGALFEGLRPVVAVREGAQGGGLELRLVVGPLSNASAAARLCATLVATGLPCQPTVFDGQRFALR
jgi:hypothetical protein